MEISNVAPRAGMISALTIPTDREGKIIEAGLKRNMDWLKKSKVDAFLVLGSTGEFPRFSTAEKKDILAKAALINGGEVPLIANCASCDTRETIELAQFAEKSGYSGISLMPQYFYPQTQQDILEYFIYCDSHYDLPTMLYNFPELTGSKIGIEVVRGFASRGKMFAIKQSGSEFDYHHELAEASKEFGFSLFSGFDTRLAEAFNIGAKGCIGGLVNIVPEYIRAIYEASMGISQDIDLKTLTLRVACVGEILGKVSFPNNVHFALKSRGLEAGAPKCRLSEGTMLAGRKIEKILRDKFLEWGLL